jgi:homogentisate 1,2-dioxygenase
MPIYHQLGKVPHKRHTVFKNEKGEHQYEQLFGTVGFDGMSSLLYHVHRPTQVKSIKEPYSVKPKVALEHNMRSLRLHGFKTTPEDDFLDSRKAILTNSDCTIILAAPRKSLTEYFYKNADCDEMIFIHKGTGTLRTLVGNLKFGYGDYLLVPRGMIYQIEFDSEDNRLFIVESARPMYTPKRYRNWFGQLLENSPFCERDIRRPSDLETHNEKGEFLIHDFEPITGRVHQPPPVHQTFETDAFVVCSFCPRVYDYHPDAIPAPYNHSNIDSDEVLYYVDGDFMSRNDIGPGHISVHPAGIPHGPHPGAMERSIGKKDTDELAVMVDTFKPLMVTEEALKIDDGKYYQSWLED